MLKLKDEKLKGVICANDMEDGQIGVIVAWSLNHLGQIVQRYGDYLINVGGTKEQGWDKYFAPPHQNHEDCQVRLLEKGETLIVD